MRVLLVTLDFPPTIGGIQTLLGKVCQNLPPDEISVLAPLIPGCAIFDKAQSYKIYRYEAAWRNNFVGKISEKLLTPHVASALRMLPCTSSIIRRERIDLLLCGNIHIGFLAYLCKKLLRKPYVLYTYGMEVAPPKSPRLRRVFSLVLENAEGIIAISNFTRGVVTRWGIDGRRVKFIPCGVDVEDFSPSKSPPKQIEKSLDGKRVILTVGRLVERKGVDKVIEAMPRILEGVPNALYIVVGDGPDLTRLKALADEMNLGGSVIFTGRVDGADLPGYYRACDVFVMPNREGPGAGDVEGYGIVFLEANVCGKPVIGGKSGGTVDAIVDGVTGILVDPQDEGEVANAILKLLSDSALARKMGERGRRRAIEELNWRKIASEVKKLLEEAVGRL
ncbi:MAG: glycosyltransferase family 4 protein [bacterium]